MSCETSTTLKAFAAGLLDELDAERVAEHLEGCAACTGAVDGGQWAEVRRAYRPRAASERLKSQVRWATRGAERARPSWAPLWVSVGAVAAGLVVALGVGLAGLPGATATLQEVAVRAHEAYLSGAAPLDVRTGDPAVLARDFSRRLDFPLQLPPMGGVGLTLLGARLIQAGGQLAALLVYQQGGETLSLTVAPRGAVVLAEGRVERFRGVDFHFTELGGRHVVEWVEGASSYALVSSGAGQSRTSCGICHGPGSGLSNVDEFHHPD